MEKKSIGYYLENYSEAIWVILMIPMCILDIYVLSVDWNIFSLIGAIFCGLSAIINFIDLVFNVYNHHKSLLLSEKKYSLEEINLVDKKFTMLKDFFVKKGFSVTNF